MCLGGLPNEIHFNIETIRFAEFASLSDDELEKWVEKEWRRKESRLKEFYQKSSFGSVEILQDDWTISVKKAVYLILCLVTYFVFFYYIPWTILIVIAFGMVSLYVKLYNGGWSRLILNLMAAKQTKKNE